MNNTPPPERPLPDDAADLQQLADCIVTTVQREGSVNIRDLRVHVNEHSREIVLSGKTDTYHNHQWVTGMVDSFTDGRDVHHKNEIEIM